MAFKTIKRELYNGRIELVFNPLARNRYLVNDRLTGETVHPPGATTIIDAVIGKDLKGWAVSECFKALGATLKFEKGEFVWYLDRPVTVDQEKLRWASKAYTRRSDKGKSDGSALHEVAEKLFKDETGFDVPAGCQKAYSAIKSWKDEVKPKVIDTELPVYYLPFEYENDPKGFGGTYDAYLEMYDKRVLWDTKTTKSGIYPENFVQLGFYAWAEKRNDPNLRIDDLAVGNFTIDGKTNVLFASDLGLSVDECIGEAMATYQLYRFLNPLKKKIKDFSPQKELAL